MKKSSTILLIALFASMVPLANFLISNVGTTCVPNGPCLIPVFPGVMAPSGVLAIGLALVLRDMVQLRIGLKPTLALVIIGCCISYLISYRDLAIASASAFIVSEVVDTVFFTLIIKRLGLYFAILVSGVFGAVIDSVVFLQLAFGNIEFIEGQIIGKLLATVVGIVIIWAIKRTSAA